VAEKASVQGRWGGRSRGSSGGQKKKKGAMRRRTRTKSLGYWQQLKKGGKKRRGKKFKAILRGGRVAGTENKAIQTKDRIIKCDQGRTRDSTPGAKRNRRTRGTQGKVREGGIGTRKAFQR